MQVEIAKASHSDGIIKIYAPFITDGVASFEQEIPTRPEMIKRIEQVNAQHAWLVLVHESEVLGYAYGGVHRARAAYQYTTETSIYMSDACIGKGMAKPFYAFLLETLQEQGYATALAGVTLPNPASENFHRSLGFTPIGVYKRVGYKFGDWHDTGWYQKELLTSGESPKERIPINELFRQESWQNKKEKLEQVLLESYKS